MIEGFFTAAGTLIVVAAILGLCYFTTRKVGRLDLGKSGGRYIRLLDRVPLGQDKAVALVQAGEKYLLLGVAASRITVLAQLSEEEVKALDIGNAGGGDFKSIMEMIKDRKKER